MPSDIDIITLPNDLLISPVQNLGIFSYKTQQNLQRGKISLAKNTISFLGAGTKEVIGTDSAAQLNSDFFIIMKSGNCLMTETVSKPLQQYHSTLFFFSDDVLLNFLSKNHLLPSKKTTQKAFHVFGYDPYIRQFVLSLDAILRLPNGIQRVLLQPKFEEIMLYLVDKYSPEFLHTLISDKSRKDNQLTSIVENNKYNRLSLAELAFLCNMSVSTFKRAFKQQYDQSPVKWFSQQRMARSAYLLRTGRKSPVELYEEAGYENYSNFIQAFKKEFGLTPKQYKSKDDLS